MSRRPRRDPRQHLIDWPSAPRPPAVPQAPPAWDFRTTFPPVLPEAIDAGVVYPEDAEPENVVALHAEQAAVMRQALVDLDRTYDARRRGVDPVTGKVPHRADRRAELPPRLTREIGRLDRWWLTLLDTYREAFGDVAADAFGRHVRSAHADAPAAAVLPVARPRRAARGGPAV